MDHTQLIEQAISARQKAYAPYSGFQVGAALLCKDGRVFHGCNVENASYGLCNCAERTALFSAIASGCKPGDFAMLAVVGDTDGPIAPCGACRQVVLELGGPNFAIALGNMRGDCMLTTASEQLPNAFGGAQLESDTAAAFKPV